jgi:hypothetical protein
VPHHRVVYLQQVAVRRIPARRHRITSVQQLRTVQIYTLTRDNRH